jgi:hypothetical protein
MYGLRRPRTGWKYFVAYCELQILSRSILCFGVIRGKLGSVELKAAMFLKAVSLALICFYSSSKMVTCFFNCKKNNAGRHILAFDPAPLAVKKFHAK